MEKKKFASLAELEEMRCAMLASEKAYKNTKTMPPMFVVLPIAVELESVMDDFCRELEDDMCVSFTGDRKWLNFRLNRTMDQNFEDFERMIISMRRAAGYRNRFGGVVRVDITSWLDAADDERMEALFAYIHDYSDEIFFIVTVSTNNKAEADDLKKAINRWVYTNVADILPLQTSELMLRVEDRLAEKGCRLSEDAVSIVEKTIERLSGEEDFAGIREVESLADAIHICSGAAKMIPAESISKFGPDGQWVSARSRNTRGFIGFEGGKSDGK